ncbi:MAG: 50S ribosomal protein L24 [Candidatus Margulisiibacteriota bacterium]
MSNAKLKIKKGDTVIVITGKDKGKKGKVLEAFPNDGSVIVERVSVVKRHMKPNRQFQGGIVEKAMPIKASKIMLVCPKCSKVIRVKKKEIDGKNVRICPKCDETVDKV